jgi:hypothetical protein
LAVVFVLHGLWFRFSWVPFQPACLGGYEPVYGGAQSLEGPLKPGAAGALVEVLERAYGEGNARLSGADRVLVRPAIGLVSSELNWNYTSRVAEGVGGASGSIRCSDVEQALMAGGKAESRAVGWGYWPWNTLSDGAFARWLRDVAR